MLCTQVANGGQTRRTCPDPTTGNLRTDDRYLRAPVNILSRSGGGAPPSFSQTSFLRREICSRLVPASQGPSFCHSNRLLKLRRGREPGVGSERQHLPNWALRLFGIRFGAQAEPSRMLAGSSACCSSRGPTQVYLDLLARLRYLQWITRPTAAPPLSFGRTCARRAKSYVTWSSLAIGRTVQRADRE